MMSAPRPVVLILPSQALTSQSGKKKEADPHNEVERRRKLKISKAIKQLAETLSPSCQCGKETRVDVLQRVVDRIQSLQSENAELEAAISQHLANTDSEIELQRQLIAAVTEHVVLRALLLQHHLQQQQQRDSSHDEDCIESPTTVRSSGGGGGGEGEKTLTPAASVSTTETQTSLSNSPPWPVTSLLTRNTPSHSTRGGPAATKTSSPASSSSSVLATGPSPTTPRAQTLSTPARLTTSHNTPSTRGPHRSTQHNSLPTATTLPPHPPPPPPLMRVQSCLNTTRTISSADINSSAQYNGVNCHGNGAAPLSNDSRQLMAPPSGQEIVQPWVSSCHRLQHLSSQATAHQRSGLSSQATSKQRSGVSSQATTHRQQQRHDQQHARRGVHRPYALGNSQDFGHHHSQYHSGYGGETGYEYASYEPPTHQMSYNSAASVQHHAPPYHSHVMSCDSSIGPHPPPHQQSYLSHTPTHPHQSQTVWRPYSESNRSSGFYLSDILTLPSSEETGGPAALGMGPSAHHPTPPPQNSGAFHVDRLLDDM